jgi:hypothetical protein
MGILKIGDMVLCDRCRDWVTGEYDLSLRCCLVRYITSLPKTHRDNAYAREREKNGASGESQLIRDVNGMITYKNGLGLG